MPGSAPRRALHRWYQRSPAAHPLPTSKSCSKTPSARRWASADRRTGVTPLRQERRTATMHRLERIVEEEADGVASQARVGGSLPQGTDVAMIPWPAEAAQRKMLAARGK